MSDNTVVTENDLTSVVEVTSAGPAGPPGGALTIQDEGVDEGLLTDKINFAGSTVSVVNDTEAEIATVTVNAADPGANTNITSLGGITGGISSPDYVQFDTAAAAAGAVGRLLWNDTDGTLEFQLKGGNVTLQIGQEQVIRVTNTAGVTMTDGQAVYITGSTGNHLNVTLAQANAEATSSKTLAVVTETIANNNTGFATSSGLVRGLDTSALTEGAAIWLSPTVPGGLTTTRPTAPDHAVLIGWCVRQHASVGVIYVHIANGYELDELHDVLITAAANNQVLRYDAATGLWKNATISPTLTLTGDVSGSATFTDLGNATLTATVADDSHNHIISNVDGLQDALDSKLPAASYTAADVLVKLKTVDGAGSGLDADLLDGQSGAYYLDFTNTTNKPDPTITLEGDVSGSVTLTDLGSGTLTATVADNSHAHTIENVTGLQAALDSKLLATDYNATDVLTKIKTVDGTGSGLDADLLDGQDGAHYLDFTNATNKPDPTITLAGDATGSVTLTDLTSGTLNVTVVDDSHNHVIANVDGLQDALDAKLPSASYTATDVLDKIKTVDGAGSGLDADLLDGQSSAYYTAINDRLGYTAENAANKGVAGGYASLDGAGLVPSTQLPSYVDDVLEFANLAAFPATGESGKIYVAVDTSKTYRWSGSTYVEISASPGSTDAVPEGSTNLYFTTARARQSISAAGSLAYDSATGVVSYTTPNTDGIAEGTANLYHTTARARGAVSAGTGISYNSSTGVITNSAPDQTVAITGSGTTTVTGTYPNFTVSSADQYVGTVTSVSGTGTVNGLTLTGTVTSSGSLTLGGTLSVDLSTATVTGTLPVTKGGTGTATQFTAGSVVFAGTSGVYTQDNANLFWDDTNNRLGIGTSSPEKKLVVSDAGNIGFEISPNDAAQGYTRLLNYNRATGAYTPVRYEGSTQTWYVGTAGTTRAMGIDSAGNVGIGTSSPINYAVYGYGPTVEAAGGRGGSFVTTSGDAAVRGVFSADSSGSLVNLKTVTNHPLAFGVNDAERMRIDASGNVGIGTSSPGVKFQIQQDQAAYSYFDYYNLTNGGGVVWRQVVRNLANTGTTSVDFAKLIGGGFVINNNDTGSANYTAFGIGGTERMRITSTGNVGIGTSSPGKKLDLVGQFRASGSAASGYALLEYGTSATATNNWHVGSEGDGTFRWYNGNFGAGTERMRLDSSGNLSVGTTAGGARLTLDFNTVNGDGVYAINSQNSSYYTLQANGSTGSGISGWANSTVLEAVPAGSGGLVLGAYSGNMIFQTGARTERMRIDASGNLGLGVTPQTWLSSAKVAQIGPCASVWSLSTSLSRFSTNAYTDTGGTARYINTAAAADYRHSNGAHEWFTAASGTAGNAISFTQAMTLDASGNLGVGTSSPGPIKALGDRVVQVTAPSGKNAMVLTTAATGGAALGLYSLDGSTESGLYSNANGPMLFWTNSTERARIDSSGNLLVGTTTAGGVEGATFYDDGRFFFDASTTGSSIIKNSTTSAGASAVDMWRAITSGDPVFTYFGTEASFTTRGSISYNRTGGVVSYNTTSDYRAKDILGPVADPGATIDALKVYTGKMKGADTERPMLIAHEAQEIVPYAVTGEKDAVNEDGTDKYQQMDHQILIPLLIAEIQSLRARVAQLEGN